ncbi:transcriptional regulator, TetR family [Thermoleophilum album]|uniref:Transcriptional regulator, TetR family n=1 Tax=Thermoleophilum album TaxID=29539 RepID=A0A1H6FIC6_THEAL|nr:transcriptional regulator, TetR family [Thermoleophilum album]
MVQPQKSRDATDAAPEGRPYGGVPASERRAARRARLIEAGLDLIGTVGFDRTTVRGVCRRAGLTERYFYEHFENRDDLLAAVYEHVIESVRAETLAALAEAPATLEDRVRAGVSAFVGALDRDRRRARVQLLESVGRDEQLEHRRREVMHEFAALLEEMSAGLLPADRNDPDERRIAALALVGATNEVVIDWVLGYLEVPRERLVEVLVRIYLAVARG